VLKKGEAVLCHDVARAGGGGARRTCPGGREQEGERGCARGSMVTGRVVWRGDREGGSRLARTEDAKAMPARCSTQSQLPEHGRLRARGRIQKCWCAREGSRRGMGGWW
jgi:hypothetical protein